MLTFELQLRAVLRMILWKGGMAVQGQPAKQVGMSVKERHVHTRGLGEGRGRKRAGQSKGGEGYPLPRQLELRLTKGAYQVLLIYVFFHTSLQGPLMCCCFRGRVVSYVTEELTFNVSVFQGACDKYCTN